MMKVVTPFDFSLVHIPCTRHQNQAMVFGKKIERIGISLPIMADSRITTLPVWEKW
jgi:hypothetical protein